LSNFEKAMELLSENKFSEAQVVLEKLKSIDDPINKESVLSNLIKVKKILNKRIANEQIELAEIMIGKRKFKEAIFQLENVDKNENFSKKKHLYLLYKSHSKSGLIQEARKIGKQYVDELMSLKKYHLLENFLPEFVKEIGAVDIAAEIEVESLIRQGRVEELNEKNPGILKDFSEDNTVDYALIKKIQDKLNERGRAFSKATIYKSTRLIAAFSTDLNEVGTWDRKKRIINEIFDGVLSRPESPMYYRILLKYSVATKRKELAYSTIEYMLKNKDILGIKRGEQKRLQKLSEEIITWPEDEDKEINYEDLDMGTDLFKEYNDGSNIFQKIKKIERDIEFLKSTNNEEEIKVLLEELRELDDEHTLVKELNEQKSKDEASRFVEKKKSLDSVKDDLLEQIQRFTMPSESDEEEKRFDRTLGIQVELLEESVFDKNKSDLVVALMEMGLYKAALKCLERNVPNDSDVREKMNYFNLKIQLLKESGKIHEALDVCQETIANYPLTNEEKINFVYQEGELARKMKKNAQAVAAYKWVDMIHPGYRLVRQRLREFEQS
jgi:tetratricopeptide (TPR) repeat protein